MNTHVRSSITDITKQYIFSGEYYISDDLIHNNSAATCDFQQCDILTSVDLDEPVQPPVTLRNSK